jgi:RNA polymerase sigma-70 factor (ECF subfamily)
MLQLDQIIKGCKKQKADCQKILYQEYYSLMMSVCSRYGKTTEDAEEMMNNGFLKIFVNINKYEGKGSFEGWMRRIMVNSCLDFLKSKEYKLTTLSSTPTYVENADTYFDNTLYNKGVFAEMENELQYSKEVLLQLLVELPEPGKTIFNLIVFEEYSHKEVAECLQIAERTSQLHFSIARKTLAEKLVKKNNYKIVSL